MGKRHFILKGQEDSEFVPLKRILMLEADGNYTNVYYKDEKGVVKKELQSGNIGKLKKMLSKQFVQLRRDVIVRSSQIKGIGKSCTVYLRLGGSVIIPKGKWKQVKELICSQLVIPFPKNDDSLKENDDSSTDQDGLLIDP